jgi:GDPmannose 4,6-dehydratase
MMWLMLQRDEPDDYVVGTAESHSVREFVERAFNYVGISLAWEGSDQAERGVVNRCRPSVSISPVIREGDCLIEIDPRYFRPTEVEVLQADITKARQQLGWQPRVSFEELVRIMVDCDLTKAGITPPGEGIRILGSKGFDFASSDLVAHKRD